MLTWIRNHIPFLRKKPTSPKEYTEEDFARDVKGILSVRHLFEAQEREIRMKKKGGFRG
jgi:hypothetical protein